MKLTSTRPGPLTGAYYWVPLAGSPIWDLLTCHDAGLDSNAGHTELWPILLGRLDADRGKGGGAFRRRLLDHYTGLPRGRVTLPRRSYLILHGDDAPIADWQGLILRRFHLLGRRVRFVYDEHERGLAEDLGAVGEVLGIDREVRHR